MFHWTASSTVSLRCGTSVTAQGRRFVTVGASRQRRRCDRCRSLRKQCRRASAAWGWLLGEDTTARWADAYHARKGRHDREITGHVLKSRLKIEDKQDIAELADDDGVCLRCCLSPIVVLKKPAKYDMPTTACRWKSRVIRIAYHLRASKVAKTLVSLTSANNATHETEAGLVKHYDRGREELREAGENRGEPGG